MDPFAEDGALVDVGGRSLSLRCQGTAGPIVLLEAGLTGDARTWDDVLAGLDPAQRVCAYDRANTGRSDPAPTPRSSQDVVDDLGTLLQAADLAPPYVLVGHSFGGIHVQLFAAEHPEEVAGLVLVESNHPDEAHQFEEHLTAEQVAADREEIEANAQQRLAPGVGRHPLRPAPRRPAGRPGRTGARRIPGHRREQWP